MAKIVSEAYPIKSFNGINVNFSLLSDYRNYYTYSNRNIKYIVIHYTGNSSDTAKANATYFSGGSRGASAHYFVDENSCYQSVSLNNAAWAVGGTKIYKHSDCRNLNSVSIEMCTSGNHIVSDTTINNTAYLCAALCEYLGISANQIDTYVLRHYDVWDKSCPAQWASSNSSGWNAFKESVSAILNGATSWQSPYLNALVNKGIISDATLWGQYDAPVTVAQAVALIDKSTGGTWDSNEANAAFHWAQPMVISLCGKGIITDKNQWLNNLDNSISKALLLALVDNATGGTMSAYVGRATDHWGRNCLDSLCDKAIIETPEAWTDFESEVSRGNTIVLVCKTFKFV